jgi:hypothetical protein
MTRLIIALMVIPGLLFNYGCNRKAGTEQLSDVEIDLAWQEGKTLPSVVFEKYPLPPQKIDNDNGINVLVDLVHQVKFVTLWGLPANLNKHGYRAIGSQASLHTVLDRKGESRVRVKWNEEKRIYPFAWHPNFEYNVVISNQSDPSAQEYLPEEQEALLSFVKKGGGLIVIGMPPKSEEIAATWSLNIMLRKLGSGFTTSTDQFRNRQWAALDHTDDWSVVERGSEGKPVIITRKYGKGYVSVIGHEEILQTDRKDSEEETAAKNAILFGELKRVSAGKTPVGGEPRYPVAGGGGGGIYPELEKHFSDIVLFFAANQRPELLRTVDEDIPKAKELIEGWLPSKPTLEPMYLILSSGGGGGWAVNAFKPKENGIISLSPSGIISIFAHELAHTMNGPVNDMDGIAGIAPVPNRGEAHAGWFQGKIDAWFDDEMKNRAVKNCNNLFDFDPTGSTLNLVTHYENEKLTEEFGKGKDWTKTWWIWQKLDDRYGPVWYPRWKWVQHTRWAGDPEHRLTWDEMVEDMSIAVGEDLFPFLRNAGLSLEKSRFESATFNGETITLPVAPITVTKAGNADLSPVGDYRIKITPR